MKGVLKERVLKFADMSQTLQVALLIAVLPLLALVRPAAAEEVEITAEPSHHLAIENAYVRAFKVSVAPHAATLMHRHRHDYVFVTLGDTSISNEVEGKEPVQVKLSDGDTRFAAGNFAHIARNLSDTPFRNVTIEFLQDEKKRAEPSPWKKDSGEETSTGMHGKILFVKDGVRVSEIELSTKSAMPKNGHDGPMLLVAVTDLELGPNADGKGSPRKALKAGDLWWSDGSSALVNEGSGPARFVILEF